MGPCGTAVWVQPPDYASAGLMFGNDDGRSMQNNVPSLNSHEAMMAGAFEGPLRGEEEDGDGEEEMVIDLDPPKSVFTTRVCVWLWGWEGAKRDGVGVVDDDDDPRVELAEEEEEEGRGIEIGWYGEEEPREGEGGRPTCSGRTPGVKRTTTFWIAFRFC